MLKCQKKWLELFLKKFLLCTFRNNVESETVLYLTNGRKRGPIRSSLDVSFSSPTTVDKEPFFTVLLQLVTQTDAFEDLIHTFSVVNRVENLVDLFLGEARSYLWI